MLTKFKNQSGQSVLELMIAMSIFVLVVSGIMFLVLDAQTANRQGGERTQASFFTQEAFEAAQSIANQGWRNLVDGDYGLDNSSGLWAWSGNSNVFDQFTRRITISSVSRDGNGDIVATGGDLDFDTKKVTVSTIWNFTTSRPSEVTLETLLTNWHSIKWLQTTQGEFNAGIYNNTESSLIDDGEVVLSPSAGIAGYNWPFDTSNNYTYDPAKIEVTGSQASLIGQLGATSGTTVNPDFSSTEVPWKYSDWDQNSGEVNVTGSRKNNGGNPGGYYEIAIPKGRNDQVGGFITQTFNVTQNNIDTGTFNFNYKIGTYQKPPISLQLFAFVDSSSGAPVYGTQAWSSGNIIGTTGWIKVSVDITSLIQTAGTYYVKLGVWVVTGNADGGKFNIGFDNSVASWEVAGGATYPNDKPTIQPKVSLAPANLVGWVGFNETAIKNGGEIYYQLSHNDGSSWSYWDGSNWSVVKALSDYNTADVINTNISSFTQANQKILWRAFLYSNGSQQVILDNVNIQYEATGFTGFSTVGDYISSAYDTGSEDTIYNYIDWTIDKPANTDIQWQLRTADTQANLPSATWVGADGTAGTYYDTPGQIITTDPSASGIRWIQYKAYLAGDGVVTPTIYDITIDYEK